MCGKHEMAKHNCTVIWSWHLYCSLSLEQHFSSLPSLWNPVVYCKVLWNTNPHFYSLLLSFTPWSRVIHEKLIVLQLVKKLPGSFVAQKFITLFISTPHWTLSWANWIQSTLSHSISLILSFDLSLGFPVVSSLQAFQSEYCMHFSYVPCMLLALSILHLFASYYHN
jgi:hypothetical protein